MTTEELELDNLDGVGAVTKAKLEEASIRNIMDLLIRGPHGIIDVTGMDMDKATTLCNKARLKLVELGILGHDFVTATEIYEKRKDIERISTGTKNIDDLLAGGFETKAITELYGEFGSGKTQLCHTLCVMVQLPKEQGGLDGGAIYIDTEGTFRPERIYSIAQAKGIDPEKALEKILVAKAYNSAHQELIIEDINRVVEENKSKLLIVDSAVAHYRAEFLGRGTLADRQQRLNKHMHLLLRIADTLGIAVIVTNQVMSSPDSFYGDPIKAVGGNVVSHTSTYRVYLKKAGRNRIARMVDSPYHAEREVVFTLTDSGVADPEEKKK